MPVAFSVATQATAAAATTVSSTLNPAGSDRYAVGALVTADVGGITHDDMDLGALSFDPLGSTNQYGAGVFLRTSAWSATAPATGSQTASGDVSASVTVIAMAMASYTGVDQTAPIGTIYTNSGTFAGTSGAASVTVSDAVAGDIIVARVYAKNDSTGDALVLSSAGTVRAQQNDAFEPTVGLVEFTAAGSAPSVSVTITSTVSTDVTWEIRAHKVNPVATPPGPRVNPAWAGVYGRGGKRDLVRMNALIPTSKASGFVGVEALFGALAAGTHATTGVLAAQAAAVAGTADHTTAGVSHATNGTLAAQDASVSGSADHRTLHTSSGALTAQSAAIAGTTAHPHVTAGSLAAQSASVSGAAAHQHVASGALEAQPASVSGTAVHTAPGVHAASGALVAGSASVAGTADLTALPAAAHDSGSFYQQWKRRKRHQEESEEQAPTAIEQAFEKAAPVKKKRGPTDKQFKQAADEIAAETIKREAQRLQEIEEDDEEALLLLAYL